MVATPQVMLFYKLMFFYHLSFLLNEEAKFFKSQAELLQQGKESLPLSDDESQTGSLNSDQKTSVNINAKLQEQNEVLQNELEDLLREREQFRRFLKEMVKTSYKFTNLQVLG